MSVKQEPPQGKGEELETKVCALLCRLREIGIVNDIKMPDLIEDVHGNKRRVDLSFQFVSVGVEVRINIECKNYSRPITLDRVDQIKTFKRELIGRNIFWLVYEGSIGLNVRRALTRSGISYMSFQGFEKTISSIHSALRNHSQILSSLLAEVQRFSIQSVYYMLVADNVYRRALWWCISPSLPDSKLLRAIWRLFPPLGTSRFIDRSIWWQRIRR